MTHADVSTRPESPPALDSLPSDQITMLLRTIRLHRDLLDAAHQDAKRLASCGFGPCYLLDYQLLYRRMYGAPESVVEMQHLLRQDDLTFIIGHGTMMEICFHVHEMTNIDLRYTRYPISDYDRLSTSFPLVTAASELNISLELLLKGTKHVKALENLRDVLERKNVEYLWVIEKDLGESVVDQHAYEVALRLLKSFPGRERKLYSNIADALNFASVVGLRRVWTARPDATLFPYLLTETDPLLEEEEWADDPETQRWGFTPTVTRKTINAFYSYLTLSQCAPGFLNSSQLDREQAARLADRAVELTLKAARIETQLKSSHGYADGPPSSIAESTWEDIAIGGRVSDSLAEQLKLLSTFIRDPVIAEAQRVYDNVRRTVANLSTPVGIPQAASSTRRLFDIILSLSRVLSEKTIPGESISFLWSSAVERKVVDAQRWQTLSYSRHDEDVASPPYLEVEKHENFSIVRWPTRVDLKTLLTLFSTSFERHNVDKGVLYVGLRDEVLIFEMSPPVTLEELYEVVPTKADTGERMKVHWIRFDSEPMDLYADVLTEVNVDPIVGIIATKFEVDHVVELFKTTSSRFLFDSWLRAVLFDAEIG